MNRIYRPLLVLLAFRSLCPTLAFAWILQECYNTRKRPFHHRKKHSPRQLYCLNRAETDDTHLEAEIRFSPLQILVNDVSVVYPVTLAQRLFSASPRRQYALKDLSWHLSHPQLILLTGDSSAGKSTLLRVIAGLAPSLQGGSVELRAATCFDDPGRRSPNSDHHDKLLPQTCCRPHPVYLDVSADTPKYDYSSSGACTTVMSIIETMVTKKMLASQIPLIGSQRLAMLLASIFMFDEEKQSSTSTVFSQSQIYRLRLLEASLESMFRGSYDANQMVFPAPLLLLDEWLDRETSTVIKNVQLSLQRLVHEMGAMVLVVTHYPERWNVGSNLATTSAPSTRQVILSMGKIISGL